MPQNLNVLSLPVLALTAVLSLGGLASAQTNLQASQAPQTGSFQGTTVTVQAKDTAYGIAKRAGLSVEALLALNGLSSADLRIGQTLRVSAVARHVVGPKETLYALSRRYGVSVNALLAENALPEGAMLSVGQVLTLPAAATLPAASPAPTALASTPGPLTVMSVPALTPPLPSAPVPPEALPSEAPHVGLPAPVAEAPAPAPTPPAPAALAPLPTGWHAAAMALLGTPYRYGGTTRAGLDCSGFVLQVFTPLGVRLPRVSADQAQVGQPVAASELQPGDLVFFDTAGGGRISHVGIYLGDDTFVSANSYQGKVSVDTLLADRYWGPRYRGARRVMVNYAAHLP